MDLCEQSVRRTGAWVSRRLWEQEGLEIEGAKERVEAESDREEAQYKKGEVQEEKSVCYWGQGVLK